jgi:molybdopterin synthase sulfur carrier subunit
MKVTILPFGKLADIFSQQEWALEGVATAGEVRLKLEMTFPALKGMRYLIAVDKKIVDDNCVLGEDSIVALLPPFSGG